MKWLQKLLCFHDWVILSEREAPSVIETLREKGLTSFSSGLVGHSLVKRVLVQTITCKKCGKLIVKKTLF